MTVTQAGASDASLLEAVHAACFARPWNAAEFAQLLSQPGVAAWRIEAAGFVLLRAAGSEAEILTLAVVPEARRQGLAEALLAEALGAAREGGIAAVFLEVAADNRAAIALYENAGFKRCGHRPEYYAQASAPGAIDALVMRRSLTAAAP